MEYNPDNATKKSHLNIKFEIFGNIDGVNTSD